MVQGTRDGTCQDLRSGMGLRVNALEVVAGDVGVYLRRRECGVPQQLLYHSEVGAAVEQVCGERVAENMRGGPLLHRGRADPTVDDQLYGARRE